MKELIARLIEKKYTIASIESVTAGLFAAKLAEVPGASAVLKGGLVTYQTSCKEDVLHVDKSLISTYGVISKEVADAMATQGKAMFKTDIVVSFSGNAGPDVMDEKPAGLIHMAIVYKDELHSYQNIFEGNRNDIREQACVYMAHCVLKLLK